MQHNKVMFTDAPLVRDQTLRRFVEERCKASVVMVDRSLLRLWHADRIDSLARYEHAKTVACEWWYTRCALRRPRAGTAPSNAASYLWSLRYDDDDDDTDETKRMLVLPIERYEQFLREFPAERVLVLDSWSTYRHDEARVRDNVVFAFTGVSLGGVDGDGDGDGNRNKCDCIRSIGATCTRDLARGLAAYRPTLTTAGGACETSSSLSLSAPPQRVRLDDPNDRAVWQAMERNGVSSVSLEVGDNYDEEDEESVDDALPVDWYLRGKRFLAFASRAVARRPTFRWTVYEGRGFAERLSSKLLIEDAYARKVDCLSESGGCFSESPSRLARSFDWITCFDRAVDEKVNDSGSDGGSGDRGTCSSSRRRGSGNGGGAGDGVEDCTRPAEVDTVDAQSFSVSVDNVIGLFADNKLLLRHSLEAIPFRETGYLLADDGSTVVRRPPCGVPIFKFLPPRLA